MSLSPSTSGGCMSTWMDKMSNLDWIGIIVMIVAGACLLYKWGRRATR